MESKIGDEWMPLKGKLVLCLIALFCCEGYIAGKEQTRKLSNINTEKQECILPIVIIGAGPAGLTAGIYCGRARLDTEVYTGERPGGQLAQSECVENWPGVFKTTGAEIMEKLEEQSKRAGARVIQDTIIQVNFDVWPFELYTQQGKKINAFSVIICTGITPERLDSIPGGKEYWGKGIASCAVCDGLLYKNKDVAVIGSGTKVIEKSLSLVPYANSITTIVTQASSDDKEAIKTALDEQEKIRVFYNKEISKVIGDEEGVKAIETRDKNTNKIETFNVAGAFIALGNKPNTNLFKDYLQLNDYKYITLPYEGSQQTSINGVFAAGTVTNTKYRQGTIAAADGCKAALEAIDWLRDVGLTEKKQQKYSCPIKQ